VGRLAQERPLARGPRPGAVADGLEGPRLLEPQAGGGGADGVVGSGPVPDPADPSRPERYYRLDPRRLGVAEARRLGGCSAVASLAAIKVLRLRPRVESGATLEPVRVAPEDAPPAVREAWARTRPGLEALGLEPAGAHTSEVVGPGALQPWTALYRAPDGALLAGAVAAVAASGAVTQRWVGFTSRLAGGRYVVTTQRRSPFELPAEVEVEVAVEPAVAAVHARHRARLAGREVEPTPDGAAWDVAREVERLHAEDLRQRGVVVALHPDEVARLRGRRRARPAPAGPAPPAAPADPGPALPEAPADPGPAPPEAPADPGPAPPEAPADPGPAPPEAPAGPGPAPAEAPADPGPAPARAPEPAGQGPAPAAPGPAAADAAPAPAAAPPGHAATRVGAGVVWRLRLEPDRLVLDPADGSPPHELDRRAASAALTVLDGVLVRGFQTRLEGRKETFTLEPEAVAALQDWLGPPSRRELERALGGRWRFLWMVPVGALIAVGGLPLDEAGFDASPEALVRFVVQALLGAWLALAAVGSTLWPHRAWLLLDALWFGLLALAVAVDKLGGEGACFWWVIGLGALAGAWGKWGQFRRFSRRARRHSGS